MSSQPAEGESFSMVREACDSYEARPLADGRTEIRIVIPARFADLWLVKLGELRGTLAEVRSLAGDQRNGESGSSGV